MLKIKKGLKKKIKGKKEKEEDLFDPENLAKYKKELEESKREAAAAAGGASAASAAASEPTDSGVHEEDEEWKRFKLLTAGIDVTLKKTSGDLDRIKTTSYFQKKVATAVVEEKKEQWEDVESEESQFHQEAKDSFGKKAEAPSSWDTPQQHEYQASVPEVKEELEFEEPEEEIVVLDDGLFDTSYLDAIENGDIQLAYIPDSPVEELGGDDPFDTSAVAEVVKKIHEEEIKEKKKVNLGFAVNFLTKKSEEPPPSATVPYTDKTAEIKKTKRGRPVHVDLLGFDGDEGEPAEQKPVKVPISPAEPEKIPSEAGLDLKDLIREFETPEQTSTSTRVISNLDLLAEPEIVEEEVLQKEVDEDDVWFRTSTEKEESKENVEENHVDPFDTSVVEKLGFGKAELKLLEDELLPATEPVLAVSPSRPPPPILPPAPAEKVFQKAASEDDFDFDPRAGEEPPPPPLHPLDEIPSGSVLHADALTPKPTALSEDQEIDPFDTSSVSHIALPGKFEIRNLEDEFISPVSSPVKNNQEFTGPFSIINPLEAPDDCISDVLEVQSPRVQDLPIPAAVKEFEDPFDTSDVVEAYAPGKAELKELESELLNSTEDFVPVRVCPLRNFKILQHNTSITSAVKPERQESLHPFDSLDTDVAAVEHHRPLSPNLASSQDRFDDPFDTSAVTAILPGKIEAKLLEEELAAASFQPSFSHTHVQKTANTFSLPPNNPAPTFPISDFDEEVDPFDTSIAESPASVPQYGSNMVDTSMASNPFLSGGAAAFSYDPQPLPVSQGENPFLSSMPAPAPVPAYGGGNPFADFVALPPVTTSGYAGNSWNTMTASYGSTSELDFQQPVSSSTQDLLSTVTGALEATSDSLLDRLRNAQPSPVPHIPSPTPSPRTPSPDLLMGDEDLHHPMPSMYIPSTATQVVTQKPATSTIDILGLYNTVADTRPKVVESIPKPVVAQPISLFDQIDDVPPMEPQVSIFGFSSEPTPLIPVSAETPVKEENKSEEGNEIVKPDEVEAVQKIESPPEPPKTEAKLPERPPPARPIQPVPERKPSPLPARPPPPVPPSPRKEPVIAPAPVPEPAPPPVVDPDSPIFEPPTVSPYAASPFDASPIFSHPSEVHSPPPVFPTPPKIEPTLAFGAPAAPFSKPDPFAAVEAPKQRGMPPAPPPPRPAPVAVPQVIKETERKLDFDNFEDRFNAETTGSAQSAFDSFGPATTKAAGSAWGDSSSPFDNGGATGFGNEDKFDEFLSLREPPPVPQSTPAKSRIGSGSDDFDRADSGLTVTIRPKDNLSLNMDAIPSLAPPPKSPAISTGSAYSEDNGSSFVPFLSSVKVVTGEGGSEIPRSDSLDSPQTPLFEEDQSQPLEDFPRIKYSGDGWEMHMRHPNKKKITGQRFWKKVYVRLAVQNDVPTVQIFNTSKDRDPIQEIPLQPCYSISDIAAQQFDQYGKIFTAKLQYVFYKERPGVRPGQITKAERITTKLSQFAAYAIQGDYQGVKEFGSDLKKLGLPLEHAPQISQLVKLGTQNFEEMKQFSMVIEEALFRLPCHRDRALTYKSEEIQVTLVDEYYVEQDVHGVVTRQIARVRLHFLSFLSGNAEIELGINDIRRQGKEVVGRHDIIPIATEEWIRIEDIEFNNCVQLNVFDETKMVKFKPPDACYIELLRFRVRPPRHRELPLQVKTVFTTTGNRIEIRCDILVPGFTSRKLGQIPCEDVMVRIPIPECWIYMFRVEKHFRYGSVKSAHRRSGKVKGIERFLGAVEAVENSLMEVTSGQAKYEHQHKSIVWRVARLPKEGQGAYTTHSFFCHITLQQHEEIPENLTKHCYVEFTMPHTTISHTVCRSVSVPNCDDPPEKCVKYLSRHEYIVEIEHSMGISPATYNLAATVVKEEPEPVPEPPMEGKAQSDSDFSDDD